MTMTHKTKRSAVMALAAAASLAAGACSEKEIDIANPNVALATGVASDPTAIQLLATGLFTDQRATRAGMLVNLGAYGREDYTFSPNEGRNVTNPLIGIIVGGKQVLDPASGFTGSSNAGQYALLRDAFNFTNTVNANAALSAAQKSAALGLTETLQAQMILELLQKNDTLGVIVDILADPFGVAPFVSRDSGYKYVLGTLDDAATKLNAGGSAFPFTLAPGFGTSVAGIDMTTPAGFLKYNRALKARAAVYYAPLGGGAAAWNAAMTALSASFLNASATTRAAFDVGAYDTYAPAPDTPNGQTQATNTSLYAHPSFQTDAQLKVGGAPDDRYTAKIRTGLPSRQGPVTADGPTTGSSTLGFSIWPSQSSPIPIIRNEELILLRAEAELGLGQKAAAIADINQVRVNSGGLPPSTLTAASPDADILTGILYEKRYSLMMEGVRWSDLRRYGRLGTLPVDVTTGNNKNFVAVVIPIAQAECFVRLPLGAAFLGPNGQNNCQ